MSAPSITNYIVKRPWLKRWMTPIAQWYTDAAGYRRLGLKFDDLIPEESETVQKAIKRLSSKEAYDRVFRLRRAVQCSISHTLLPPHEQTKPEEVSSPSPKFALPAIYRSRPIPLRGFDVEYLSPIIREIEKEAKERADLDNLVVRK
ncbi:Cytochrome b-c1 complex subunit 7 [Penicillium brasilianum]|uniref:Cytochrome b-c1 complex subunit 7 n=1 Tax=Penicillium brasilianum TaxID=104259 RepID=A0A1S9RL59_PENBI|nr:Cytochrome b-c1 complex subunit 7 [Penicillium brasilianum]